MSAGLGAVVMWSGMAGTLPLESVFSVIAHGGVG
jgi:hypothetical protein